MVLEISLPFGDGVVQGPSQIRLAANDVDALFGASDGRVDVLPIFVTRPAYMVSNCIRFRSLKVIVIKKTLKEGR